MSKRTYKAKPVPEETTDRLSQLPVDQPIGVYYRQSTEAQIGNISTTIQTVDMVENLKARGWDDKNILMYDRDAGISGSKKIDQRPSMKALFADIVARKIGAVACQDEDRLFRDVTQIQVNVFIEACREAEVLVITPTMVYDFAHPQMGNYYIRQFRFKCEMAAEYITSYVRGRLHVAKKHRMLEGKWAGGTIPPGFMIDERETLPDGSQNPDYRRYVEYSPHADIIRSYFQLFLDNAGNVRKTLRHILENGGYFPDPKTWQAPKGFRFMPPRTMKNAGKGFCPGTEGLHSIFTNAAYIGHWTVNDVVMRWNNHRAIVPLNTFIEAFNYLSPTNLNGSPNTDFKPFNAAARPSKDEERPVERPLCEGMIFTKVAGKWKRAGTYYQRKWERYAYSVLTPQPLETVLWWKKADYVDEEVDRLLRKVLGDTFSKDAWETAMASYSKGYVKEAAFKEKQLSTLQSTMDNLVVSLETLANPEMIRRVQQRYEDAKDEYKRLSEDIASAETQIAQIDALRALKSSIEPALQAWDSISRSRKQVILHTFVERIVASIVEKKVLEFVVYWRDGNTSSFIVRRKDEYGLNWLSSEVSDLLEMVDRGASQVEIAAKFPTRKWRGIHNKVWALRGKGSLLLPLLPIYDQETFRDYLRRTDGKPETYRARSGEKWNDSNIARLKELVAGGASQVEIAATFPNRNWGRLRATITKFCGSQVKIPGAGINGLPGEIRKNETYAQYVERTQNKNQEKKSDDEKKGGEPDEDELVHSTSQYHPETVRPGAPA